MIEVSAKRDNFNSSLQMHRKIEMQDNEKCATTVRLDKDSRDALEQFRREQDEIPTLPKAIEQIVRDWLQCNGYLAVNKKEEDAEMETVT